MQAKLSRGETDISHKDSKESFEVTSQQTKEEFVSIERMTEWEFHYRNIQSKQNYVMCFYESTMQWLQNLMQNI